MKRKIRYEQRQGKYFYKVEDGIRTRITKSAYDRFTGQSTKLVTKQGKVLNQKLLSRLEKKYGKAEVSITLRDIFQTPGKKATYKYVHARLESSALDKLFINMGRSPEELAREINVSVSDIENSDLWKDGRFYAPNGKVYEVVFNYEGDVFREIKADE